MLSRSRFRSKDLAEKAALANRLAARTLDLPQVSYQIILHNIVTRQKSTKPSEDVDLDLDLDLDFLGDKTSDDSDLELGFEDLQNVSRLPANRYKQYHGLPPDAPYKDLIHKRQRYATYGFASGEDARVLWPSRRTILAMEEEEKEEEEGSKTLMERLSQIQSEQKAAEEEQLDRRKRIEHNMSQMSKWIAEYHQKQTQAQQEASKRAAKKEVLLEEARDYFGYKIQSNDPKFQQMVEEKEEKERAEVKKLKKEEKAKKLAARMAQDMTKSSKSDGKTVP